MKEIKAKNAPAAIGPYSQGIEAMGTTLYVSGQLPIDPATGHFPEETIQGQTRQSLENIKAILEAGGYTLGNVVKATVFLKDINDFGAMNAVYGDYFRTPCPARAAFQVGALPKRTRVEIEVVDVK